MNHWKTVKSIWEKVEAKNPVGTLTAHWTTTPQSQFTVRINYARTQLQEPHLNHKTGGALRPEKLFKITSDNQQTAYSQKPASAIAYLNFNTDVERYNAWQSYLTKFARFCICMDESTKLAPYMGNYTQPWDDQRFYTYFGLTQPEIQLIETVIK